MKTPTQIQLDEARDALWSGWIFYGKGPVRVPDDRTYTGKYILRNAQVDDAIALWQTCYKQDVAAHWMRMHLDGQCDYIYAVRADSELGRILHRSGLYKVKELIAPKPVKPRRLILEL